MASFLTHIRNHFRRKIILYGLQRQRHLLRAGYIAIADVVEVKPTCIQVNNLIEVRLSVAIHRPDGKILISECRSVVKEFHIPAAGEKLKIHFLPQDTSYILIL